MMPSEDFYQMIGEKTELLRKARKMTRVELAEAAGISEKFLYEIERKGKGVSAWTLYCISSALDVRMDVFMEVERVLGNEMNSLIQSLSKHQSEEIFKLIHALNKYIPE